MIEEDKVKKIEIKNNNKAIIYSKNNEDISIMGISSGESFERKVEKVNEHTSKLALKLQRNAILVEARHKFA